MKTIKNTRAIQFFYSVVPLMIALLIINSCKKVDDKENLTDTLVNAVTSTPFQYTLKLRSEYEKVGNIIIDLNDASEGSKVYTIGSGNSGGFYSLDPQTGRLTIAKVIPDIVGTVTTHTLKIWISGRDYVLKIADGYDYTLQNLPAGYSAIENHNERYVDNNSEYTAYNNLWGKGTAVVGQDFRMATLHKTSLPDSTIFVWDTPGLAADFGGSSVWSYINIFWGDRNGIRTNLTRFPFQINKIQSLKYSFDFEKLYGSDDYKIAMNTFLTDVSYLTDFSKNRGDFFFVFNQVGDFIPPYPTSLPDTTLVGEKFARRYQKDAGTGYEYRRVIIKDDAKLLNGTVDLKNIFNGFSSRGYINPQQYLYHIQVGLEITKGYGALRFNKSKFDLALNN